MTADTGSRAPKIAVGVDPINCMARVVQAKEMTVGIIANANKLSQPVDFDGSVRGLPNGTMTTYTILPQPST